MPMAYASQASATPSSGTAITITKPAGTVSGDVLVAMVEVRLVGGAPTVTPPAGWTLVGTALLGSNNRVGVWTRVAGGSEPANYTWTASASVNGSAGLILRYVPQTPTQAPGVVDAVAMGSVSSPASAPSVNATGDNDTLIALFSTAGSVGSTPTDMTQRAAIGSGSDVAYAYDQLLTQTGATGTREWTGSTTAIGFTVALLANQGGSRIRMMV